MNPVRMPLRLALIILIAVAQCRAEEPRQYFSDGQQDKWILEEVFPKVHNGFFVEIGAWDAVKSSNSKALELDGWNGICVEPFPQNWTDRKCQLFKEVAYSRKGEVVEFRTASQLGGIDKHIDRYKESVSNQGLVKLVTTTTDDILERGKAPSFIHYISVDTEGSEHEILSAFPFSKYTVGAFTIEHNHEETKRAKIRQLLEKNGYRFVREQVTDDFYVRGQPLPKDQAVTDLTAINKALKEYFSEHSFYPISSTKDGRQGEGWDGKKSCDGRSGADWIQDLAPKYITELPSDSRNSPDCNQHYIYRSDGKDFKLLSHYPMEFKYISKTHTELIDPHRPDHAVGFWSGGARDW